MAKCENGKKPRLKGKRARFQCRRCGQRGRKKKDLCKPEKL